MAAAWGVGPESGGSGAGVLAGLVGLGCWVGLLGLWFPRNAGGQYTV